MNHDYSEEQDTPQSDDGVVRLRALCDQMNEAELEVLRLEKELKAAEARHREYEQNLVPTAMQDLGLKSLQTSAGLEILLKESVRASFPKDPEKREKAFAWLRENHHDGLIKNSITLTFGRDEDTWAREFGKALVRLGVPAHATIDTKSEIHHQTLVGFLKEQLRDGTSVPLEAFGAFVQSFAQVRRPRDENGKRLSGSSTDDPTGANQGDRT